GDQHPAKQLSNLQVSLTLDTASALNVQACRIRSAIIYAGVEELSTAPSHMGSPTHQRLDTFCNNRGRTTVSLPSLAVFLWHHRPVCVWGFQIRPLLHTFCAVLPGRDHGRWAADGRIGLETSRSRLSSDGHLGFASPSVGYLHGFLRTAYLILY